MFGRTMAIIFAAPPASAHHEAIFGPQSSLVLSAPGFVSTQAFTKNLGTEQRSQETTFVLSGGIHQSAASGSDQKRRRSDGHRAVEPPTGTMDHSALNGPFNYVSAAITSLERGAFGTNLIHAVPPRRQRHRRRQEGKGDELIFGGGVAYTPLDHPGRMLSFQLGMSEENHRRSVLSDQTIAESGGYEWMLTPAIVGSPHPHVQLFGLFSLPLSEGLRDPAERSRWRAGCGIVYLIDAETEQPK